MKFGESIDGALKREVKESFNSILTGSIILFIFVIIY